MAPTVRDELIRDDVTSKEPVSPTPSRDLYGSLRTLRSRYADLPAPAAPDFKGTFRAEFVGPAWLRATAGPSIALGGLRGWWGKRFDGAGAGTNLLKSKQGMQESLAMHALSEPSLVDGQDTLALHYVDDAPFPWRHVVDEVRVFDSTRYLAMTVIDVPLLRRLAFPFVLHRTVS